MSRRVTVQDDLFNQRKDLWNTIIHSAIGGEVGITSFTGDTTFTGLVPKPGHRLEIFQIFVSSENLSVTEGIGDVCFFDGAL